jgi:RNA polymerase sigma-70 factor (sigma-E family)
MEPFDEAVRHVGVEETTEEEVTAIVSDPRIPGDLSSPDDLSGLYRRQSDAMVRLARLLTGSDAVAQEVVQEAFLKMHQRGDAPDNPEGYLRTTVANLAKSHLRRLRLERRLPGPDRFFFDDPEIDETWEAVGRLPFRQRSVLALRFYSDLSEAEIARVLGCRPGTVKSSLSRGLAKLREELA